MGNGAGSSGRRSWPSQGRWNADVPGSARGLLAAGPSPACTPACRQGASPGCSCPEWHKPRSSRQGGTATGWVTVPCRPAPEFKRCLVPAVYSAAWLSGTCCPHTATAALCTGQRASLHPCHPHRARMPWDGSLTAGLGWDAPHPSNAGSKAGFATRSILICSAFPTAPWREQPLAAVPASQGHPEVLEGCAMGNTPHSAAIRDPNAWPPSTSSMGGISPPGATLASNPLKPPFLKSQPAA